MKEKEESARDLYEDGRFGEVIDLVNSLSPEDVTDFLLMKKIWSLYRMKRFEEALSCASPMIKRCVPDAIDFWVQYCAYVSKDDKALEELYRRDSGNPSVVNAIMIRARDKDVNYFSLDGFFSGIDPLSLIEVFYEKKGTVFANIFNNTARYFMTLPDTIMFPVARDLIKTAFEKYGKGNFNHRAALSFHASVYYEQKGYLKLAFKEAGRSFDLWKEAYRRDPQNNVFKSNLDNAWKRVEYLKDKIKARLIF